MKQIMVKDCLALKKEFDEYCKTAQQYQFFKLFLVKKRFEKFLNAVQEADVVENQEQANTMFCLVLQAMGKDCSEYTEEGKKEVEAPVDAQIDTQVDGSQAVEIDNSGNETANTETTKPVKETLLDRLKRKPANNKLFK